MDNQTVLYLIPVSLGGTPEGGIYARYQLELLNNIHHFVAENASTARKMLKGNGYIHPLQETEIIEFNEHNRGLRETMDDVLNLFTKADRIGLMSEAGMPCVADPGFEIVKLAHQQGRRVVPWHGPSSIIQALAASGMQGERFIFHGYLPAKTDARKSALRNMSLAVKKDRYTHIFMEAPYRSNQMLESIVAAFPDDVQLSVASELGCPDEWIGAKKIGQWKKSRPDLNKKRCIFCVSA